MSTQANGVYCRYCGSTPAVDLDFRAHRGMVFIMQFRKLPGPYWGPISAIIANPVTLLINLVNRARLQQLGPPIPGAPSLPMNPGRPLWQRPAIVGLFLPFIVLGLIVYSGAHSSGSSSNRNSYSYLNPPSTSYTVPSIPMIPSIPSLPTTQPAHDAKSAKVGDCVWDKNGDIAKDDHPKVEVVECGDQRAQATVLAKPTGPTGDTECDNKYPATDVIITHKTSFNGGPEIEDFALCLQLK